MWQQESSKLSWLSLGVVAVIVTVVALGLTGCDKNSSSSSGGSGGGSSSDAAASQGDPEAVKAARAELEKHWVKAGAGWISEFPSKTYIATGQRAGPESFFRQIKSLTFSVESIPLSDSDKLNGYEFAGNCDFSSPPVRLYNDPNAFGAPHWDAWHPSIESLKVYKVKGKWKVDGGYLISGEKPAAALVAKLLAEGEKAGG